MKRVKLPKPLAGHRGETITEIVLREPTFGEYMEHGEPVEIGKAPNGSLFRIERPEVYTAYLRTLLVEPNDPLLLQLGGIKVGRLVKEAVESFFRDDAEDSEALRISQTSSSSSASETSASPLLTSIG